MAFLLHHLLQASARRAPGAPALLHKDQLFDYASVNAQMNTCAQSLLQLEAPPGARIATYLPKQVEAVTWLFGASLAGCVFVPINPVLKAEQVGHILRDCDVDILITSEPRMAALGEVLVHCPALRHLVLIDAQMPPGADPHFQTHRAADLGEQAPCPLPARIDADIAAILYTSGSTGKPKGVVLSHANLCAGARSVEDYLKITPDDRLLALLPLSFDYGLNQIVSAFLAGASVVLLEYLLPRDVIRAVIEQGVTGVAAVPPLWNQLGKLDWPQSARECLRYITSSGGSMPTRTTTALRRALPDTQIFLMYGLTEAFRSTCLDPQLIDQRPDSIGKAIPNAQVMVVRPDGSECDIDEPGELVHRGALVAQGYWNDPQMTAQRFRPAPGQTAGCCVAEIAVWSGDQVRRDSEGFLYFIGRDDELIKTSGYRVSPAEIEEVALALESVQQAAAIGVPHPLLGQGIVLLAQAECDNETLRQHCQAKLPGYMLPGLIEVSSSLPHNANGKIDRSLLARQYADCFADQT